MPGQLHDEELHGEGKKIFYSFAIVYVLLVSPFMILLVVRGGMQSLPEHFAFASSMLLLSLFSTLFHIPFVVMSFFEMPHGILLLSYFGLIACLRKFSIPFLQYKVLVPLIFLWCLYGLFCIFSLQAI